MKYAVGRPWQKRVVITAHCLIFFTKEEIVELKELKKTLAGLGLAGLIAGAGVAVPAVSHAGSS